MFRKVLIANRGEIAIRILRACRELGIRTVAIFSEADRRAAHVRHADEAYLVGPALARESYMHVDRILDIAEKSKAEAVHPGYGFLSENAAFAEAVEGAGLTFIGPPASAIAAMGDKLAARRLMREAGVPVVPGSDPSDLAGPRLTDNQILSQAEEVGFPLFIKAAAGGGGRGMRLVHSMDELSRSLDPARQEVQKAFGDNRIYLERAVFGARHIEIQILADAHGHTIHLGERECSIQRRHQKLVEEAPSPAVDADLRGRMGQVAIQAATAVGYSNAGTVEFLLDRERNFYFLEMNTRLQVEHPITESVTGVDIVKEQLSLATGAPLGYRQEDIQVRGHAIECRITAENPFHQFWPTTGRILRLFWPSGLGIRIDSGIHEGYEVSPFYDSLLAKLIAWGRDRQEALQRMRSALSEYRIAGVQTSIPFHQWIMEHDVFVSGAYDTAFLEQHSDGASGLSARFETERDAYRRLAAIVATLLNHERRQQMQPPVPAADRQMRDSRWKAEQGWKTPTWREVRGK